MTKFERAVLTLWRDKCDTALIAALLTRDGFCEDKDRKPISEALVYNTLARLRDRQRAANSGQH